jgi:hypothetical protein
MAAAARKPRRRWIPPTIRRVSSTRSRTRRPSAFSPAIHSQPEINMNKAISLALLVGGIILIIYGVYESDSVGSSFSRFFTGNPTDKSMWLMLGGKTV